MDTKNESQNNTMKYYCELCDHSSSHRNDFNKHLLSSGHKKKQKCVPECVPEGVLLENEDSSLVCELCDFKTCRRDAYTRHIESIKHKRNVMLDNEPVESNFTCACGLTYKNKSGLYKHKNNCSYQKQDINIELFKSQTDLIKMLIKENSEMKHFMQESMTKIIDSQNSVIETAVKHGGSNNNNNIGNNLNSHNKTFNLQVFLNETCKDAMNFSEFIDTIQPNLEDVENVGKNGFINGISDILIRYLTALDVKKRPVHCSDSKRETIYIKENDVWGEEDLSQEENKLLQLIWDVRDKNANNVHKWRDLYPQCLKPYSDKTDQYNYIVHEAMGGDVKLTKKEKEAKIISKIAKCISIDKSKFKT
jgi:hypothetical protein